MGYAVRSGADLPQFELRGVPSASYPDAPEGAIPWPFSPVSAIELWVSSPPLAAISGLISRTLSGARVEAYSETLSNPLEALKGLSLFYAGVRVSWSEFVEAVVQSLEATGNAFAEAEVPGDEGGGFINLLPPQYCSLTRIGGELHLTYSPPFGGLMVFPPLGPEGRGYVHVAHRGVYHPAYGLPPWIGAATSVEVDRLHRQYLRGFMGASAAPRFVVLVGVSEESGTKEHEAQQLADTLASFFRSEPGSHSGRNMVVAFPAGITIDFRPVGSQADDPTYPTLSKTILQEILMVRGVSMLHLGITEGGYRATASEQARGLVESVIRPAAEKVAALVSAVLWPGGEAKLEFAIEDRDSVLSMVDAAVRAAGVPVLTPDEARAILGYEPLGDNTLWRPTSLIPVDSEE